MKKTFKAGDVFYFANKHEPLFFVFMKDGFITCDARELDDGTFRYNNVDGSNLYITTLRVMGSIYIMCDGVSGIPMVSFVNNVVKPIEDKEIAREFLSAFLEVRVTTKDTSRANELYRIFCTNPLFRNDVTIEEED